jgi:hypothetical protein
MDRRESLDRRAEALLRMAVGTSPAIAIAPDVPSNWAVVPDKKLVEAKYHKQANPQPVVTATAASLMKLGLNNIHP